MSHDKSSRLKPIFHCDAKLLALGTFASPNAKDSTFALPNTKSTNMLVSLALGDANFLHWPCTFLFFCVDFHHLYSTGNGVRVGYPTRTPFPVEYRWRWVPNAKVLRWPCRFYVVYVNFICVRHPTQTCFSVEYGL